MSAPAYDSNGSYPTRAELYAHLQPIREDLKEIRDDVKSLLRSQAGSAAVAKYRRWLIATVIALLAVIATALAFFLTN